MTIEFSFRRSNVLGLEPLLHMPRVRPAVAAMLVALSAAGCGGGGGGGAAVSPQFPLGSTPSPTPQDLTSLPVLTELNVAFRTTASLRIGDGYYLNLTAPAPRVGIRTSAGNITEVALSVPELGIRQSFTTMQLDPLDGNVVPGMQWASSEVTVAGRDTTVDIIDPAVGQLRYHTFGNWGTEISATSLVVGYVVLGTPTPVASVPATGSATYSGAMNAVYTAAGAGVDSFFDVTAAASATADFNLRSITFSTTGTVRQSVLNSVITPDATLNLSGTLTYASGSNQFSGTLTSGGGLSGTATGGFFGPAGQEIGGTFVLRDHPSTPTTHMFGAFGLHQ